MQSGGTADVVIVGGGIAGCAAAYYLTTMGVRPIVVEREEVAGAASGFAQGGLYIMSGPGMDGPFFPFVKESLRLHHELYPIPDRGYRPRQPPSREGHPDSRPGA